MKKDTLGKCFLCLAPGKMCGTSPTRMALCSNVTCVMGDEDSAILVDAWEAASELRQERDLLFNLRQTSKKVAYCGCEECNYCMYVEAYEKWKDNKQF